MEDSELIELVQLAQRGDREAFGRLAACYQPTLFAIALRRLRNRAEAYETVQDVLIQAMRKLPQLREPERFAGWIRQIAVRMSINRAVRRPPDVSHGNEAVNYTEGAENSPLDCLLESERAAAVWGGLSRLRDLDRKTLIAFYVEGRSLKEMSDDFASPVGTIKRRLHTARSRLREELGELELQTA